jgi:hypothetical protein
LEKESPFFEDSQGGTKRQKATDEVPTTAEDRNITLQGQNRLGPQNVQGVALCQEVDILRPGKNDGRISFGEFIFG